MYNLVERLEVLDESVNFYEKSSNRVMLIAPLYLLYLSLVLTLQY